MSLFPKLRRPLVRRARGRRPSKAEKRKHEIIRALSEMSRNGWRNARSGDYEALERELRELNAAMTIK